MRTTTPSVSQINRIIQEMEGLRAEAQDIFDAHIDYVQCQAPSTPFGTLKHREIAVRAGNTMDYVAALRIVRKKIIGDAVV